MMAEPTPAKPATAANVKFQTTVADAPLKKPETENAKLSARTLAEQTAGRDVLKERGAVK